MMTSQSPVPSDTVKVENSAEPGDNESPSTLAPAHATIGIVSKELLELMSGIVKVLTDAKKDDGEILSTMFQRMLQRRLIPDYFEVIKEPVAFSTIRAKILKKQYKGFQEFVRDVALISHNAQVYNRPSAPVYGDAILLREILQKELGKLVEQGIITAEEAELPDLGPIPEVEDSPPPASDEPEDEEEDDEDEDEDEEEEESDEEGRKRRGRKRGRLSSTMVKRDDIKDDAGQHKTRGRPPKVETAMEKRISALIKGLRKFKGHGGGLKIIHFERLPDKTLMPEYYQEIKNPIAMDLIKKRAKRKKYQSVDQVLRDLELMFENAKAYNLESSAVYKDAVDLQHEARGIAEQEKQKPDSDFVDEDGRLPLPSILYKGEIHKVGDWVHLNNDNDMTKPIPAQIYRTWRDSEGHDWINACWYFRPEQTVHRFEKHFFENEVVKTGRYEDHRIEDVVDRCFVMFFTRYNKGRPRGFPANKQVYVCEARYNEIQFKLNKIKTWASCVPDEVRDKDYEMDLFDVPRKMKKIPSPIKYLLKDDAKESDPLPQPTWGTARGPPTVGNVHRRPREGNESPPPEPTPSPPPMPAPSPVRRPPPTERPRYESQGDMNVAGNYSNTLPSPLVNQTSLPIAYNQHNAAARPLSSPAPMLHHQSSYTSHTSTNSAANPTSHNQIRNSYNQYSAPTQTPITQNPVYQSQHTAQSLVGQRERVAAVAAAAPSSVPHTSHTPHSTNYNPPRLPEVYTFDEMANSNVPVDIRAQFHHDKGGKIIWYTTPPLDCDPLPERQQPLGHSLRYLADKARNEEAESRKRSAHRAEMTADAIEHAKRQKTMMKDLEEQNFAQNVDIVQQWCTSVEDGTDEIYQQLERGDWKTIRTEHGSRIKTMQAQAHAENLESGRYHEKVQRERNVRIGAVKL